MSVGRNAQLLDVDVEAVQVGKIAWNVLGRLHAVVQVEVCCGRNVRPEGRKEGNVLFNDALNAFYLWLYGRKEMFYLTMHSTHFIYSYMASDIW